MRADTNIQTIDGRAFKRIALVADTHGPIHHAINNQLSKYDCVIHAGDLGGWKGVLPQGSSFYAVIGNNDIGSKWPSTEREYLARLPEVLKVTLRGGDLVIIHGHQYPAVKTRHAKLRQAFPSAKAVVYGHSHRALIDKASRPWIINPGAGGYKRTYGGACFIALSILASGWRLRRIVVTD